MSIYKNKRVILFIALIVMVILLNLGCPTTNTEDPNSITSVVFQGVVQTGGTTETVDSTGLILTFSADPTTLTADNITLTGATKGALTGTGTTRTLAISNITVANGQTVSVAITSPRGYNIMGSPKTAVVYRKLVVGMPYKGGIIAYIFQEGDPGYVAGEVHGLIATTTDFENVKWTQDGWFSSVNTTDATLGKGMINTNTIVNVWGFTNDYAARRCYELVVGEYDDWFLPSLDELNKLYLNKNAIGGFADAFYWSSTEYTYEGVFGRYYAFAQSFVTGGQFYTDKTFAYKARAVRYF